MQLALIPEERLPEPVYAHVRLVLLPRELYGPAPTSEMVASVRNFGVLKPVILTRATDGALEVEDGRSRVIAAREAALETIPAHIYPRGLYAPGIITMMLNRQHRDNPAAELHIVERLLGEGYAIPDICRATGKTKQELNALLCLLQLRPELRAALDAGKVSTSCAGRAARLTEAQQLRLVRNLANNGKISASDVSQCRLTEREAAQSSMPWDRLLKNDEVGGWKERIGPRVSSLVEAMTPDTPEAVKDLVLALRRMLEGSDENSGESTGGADQIPDGEAPVPA